MSDLPSGKGGVSQVTALNSIKSISLTVGTSAVSVNDALTAAGITKWIGMHVQQLGGNNIFYGDSAVLPATS